MAAWARSVNDGLAVTPSRKESRRPAERAVPTKGAGCLKVQPTFSPLAFLRRQPSSFPFPLDQPNCRIYSSTLGALLHGLRALGVTPGDEVLVPALHHASVVETLLNAGLTCRFFDGMDGVHPDADELHDLCTPRTRCLYLTHLLGFPQDAASWRKWCDARGIILVEDATQTTLTSAEGSLIGRLGDLALFSFSSTAGLPDLAAMVVRVELLAPTPPAPAPGKPTRWHARLHQRARLARILSTQLATRPRQAAWGFLSPSSVAPLRVAPSLLSRLVEPSAVAWRRLVYELLLEEFPEHVPVPFRHLPNSPSPWAFPYRLGESEEVLARLRSQSVEWVNMWPSHPTLDEDHFPRAAAMRRRVIGLPLHQGLRCRDVERVATCLRRGQPPPAWRLEPMADFSLVQADWKQLATRSGNLFLTWEWMSLWWRHFRRGGRLRLTACRSAEGRIRAILPMYQSMWLGARVVRFVGHLGDQLGLVCAHEDQARATLELRRLTDETPRADLYLIERLPGGREWARLLDGHLVSQVSNPVLQRRGRSWDVVRFSFSRNLRQDIGYRGRRLHRKHRVTYRLVDDVQQLPAALDALERLHQARWGSEGQVSAAQWRFYREFAAVALDRGWLRLWLLQLDERAAAAILGFRYGGDEWFVQAGRNPDFDADGAGFVLLAHAIQTSMMEGVGAFRFLRGDEPYKRRFANGDDGLATVAVPTSPVGGLLTGGLLAGRSLPNDLRLWAARKAHL